MQNSELIDRFHAELTGVRDCAENTVRAYLNELNGFAAFLTGRGRELDQAVRQDFVDFKGHLSGRKAAGVAMAIKAVRCFYNAMSDLELLVSQFPATLKVRVKHQEPPDVPTAEQFIAMRRCLEAPVTDSRAIPIDIRRCVVEVLAGSGLRIEALLTMKPRHLRFGARPHVLVEHDDMSCKGKRAGEVPISPYAARLLKLHLQNHPCSFDAPVFDLSASMVRKILLEIAPEGVRLKPHSLRHFYCAMNYFKNFDGGKNDVLWLRDAAGHGNIATTNNYLKMARRVCQSDQEWRAWAHGLAIAEKARIA